ncbi:hypothetical protein CCACVL1_02308 [Corchorus capsularis]|uniref:Uncharacterized protein n=1 Tax=Corchorus capsularis TaxID=210143 RepID=A0A1R3K9J1_COCAP|nr:hypothetical protein CCACVL1_02846 [Corchorus capsularis]OMP03688.1 hypothetical protein CCACVL1_02308 [Corchorus capsularis]
MSDYADLYMFWPRPFPLRRGSLFRHIAYNGNRTPSAASGRMENVLLRSSNLLGGGVMNRDLPPAVFSSYHFTSRDLISSDPIGRGEGEGRDGWSGNSNGRS